MKPPVRLPIVVDDLVVKIAPFIQLTEVRHPLQHHHLHLQHVVELVRVQRLPGEDVSIEDADGLGQAQPTPLDELRALLEKRVMSGVEEGRLVLGPHQFPVCISVLGSKHLGGPLERVLSHLALRCLPGCLHSFGVNRQERPGSPTSMSEVKGSEQSVQDHRVPQLLCFILALGVARRCLPLLVEGLTVLESDTEADGKLLLHLFESPGKEGEGLHVRRVYKENCRPDVPGDESQLPGPTSLEESVKRTRPLPVHVVLLEIVHPHDEVVVLHVNLEGASSSLHLFSRSIQNLLG
mmetsp:Transcript_40561/g.127859  ORF Transcript_40561/g.127859 Transcript_40561/m.127859 type:complete len:294 (+) Transcript_40561:3407-4288(+)